jgi:hypothetical protein
MARVQGVREKVHLPIYDSVSVEPEKQLREAESSSILKFFVNVQNKTKLQTNLQSASLLPHYNTFEARAMRVVISDLPPEFPSEDAEGETEDPVPVMNDPAPPAKPVQFLQDGTLVGTGTVSATNKLVFANVKLPLSEIMSMLKEARESGDDAELKPGDDGVELVDADGNPLTISATPGADGTSPKQKINNGGVISLSVEDLEAMAESLEKRAPAKHQLRPNNGAGNMISQLIYNTVTTFFVGEKVMIQMPTWFFPAGAGPYSETAHAITHGEPSPLATFRFAEPIFIDKQQNFRVEIEIPDSDVLKELQKTYGPLRIWVVLDGFMTRDVQ